MIDDFDWDKETNLLEKIRNQIIEDENNIPPKVNAPDVKLPKIYLDMDGVIVDFEKAVRTVFRKKTGRSLKWNDKGMVANDKDESILIDVVRTTKQFWENLEWTNNGKKLFKFVGQYRPNILSAFMNADLRSKRGKRVWLKQNIGMVKLGEINIVRRKEKPDFAVDYATKQSNILIDDSLDNIRKFESAGGFGILHSDKNYRQTIRKLKEIGFE